MTIGDDADFRFLREVALPKLGANYYRHTEQAAREALDRIEKRIKALTEGEHAPGCAMGPDPCCTPPCGNCDSGGYLLDKERER